MGLRILQIFSGSDEVGFFVGLFFFFCGWVNVWSIAYGVGWIFGGTDTNTNI